MIVDPFLTLSARCFLAVLLVAAALHKIADWPRTIGSVGAFRVVPDGFERLAAGLVVSAELAIGVFLLIPRFAVTASMAAVAVLGAYLGLIGWKFARGERKIDCGCSLHGGVTPLSAGHLVRNAVLIAVAIFALAPDTGRTLGWIDAGQVLACAISLFLTYLSADALLTYRFKAPARAGAHR